MMRVQVTAGVLAAWLSLLLSVIGGASYTAAQLARLEERVAALSARVTELHRPQQAAWRVTP